MTPVLRRRQAILVFMKAEELGTYQPPSPSAYQKFLKLQLYLFCLPVFLKMVFSFMFCVFTYFRFFH